MCLSTKSKVINHFSSIKSSKSVQNIFSFVQIAILTLFAYASDKSPGIRDFAMIISHHTAKRNVGGVKFHTTCLTL